MSVLLAVPGALALPGGVLTPGAGAEAFAQTLNDPTPQRGLAVVLDPETLQRGTSVESGETITAYVVLTALDIWPDGAQSLQFGLEIDPRLVLAAHRFGPNVSLPFQVGPTEWAVALSQCANGSNLPLVVMQLDLFVRNDVVDLDGITVDVVDPVNQGEPMLFLHCASTGWSERLVDFGGITLNPGVVRVLAFAASDDLVVQGHEYELAWDTRGSIATTLDGAAVGPRGVRTMTANARTTHVLQVRAPDGSTQESRVFVDVITRPVVRSFEATLQRSFDPPRVRLAWDVAGVDDLFLSATGETVPPRGARLVSGPEGSSWSIAPSNEFGTTFASATAEEPAPTLPRITSFAAAPVLYLPGSSVQLAWQVAGADAVSVEPGVGPVDPSTGSVSVTPEGGVVYVLTASNAVGTRTAQLVVHPTPPVIDRFTASPAVVDVGGEVLLEWNVRGAEEVEITPGVGLVDPVAGSLALVPETDIEYTLTARNTEGFTSRSVPVDVLLPQIHDFSVSPKSIFPPEPVNLSWDTTAGTSILIEPGGLSFPAGDGSVQVTTPADSTVYRMRLVTASGDTLRDADGPVIWKRPTVNLTVNDDTPALGQTVFVRLRTAGADSTRVEPFGETVLSSARDFVVTVDDTLEVMATGYNRAGTTVRTLVLFPVYPGPEVSLSASTLTPYAGTPIVLSASVDNADSARIDPDVGPIPLGSSSHSVAPVDTTEYVLTAYSAIHGERTANVVVRPRLPQAVLAASTPSIPAGTTARLSVTVLGATEATLLPEPGPIDGTGVYEVIVDETTEFVLTATNPLGSVSTSTTVEVTAPRIDRFVASRPEVVGDGTTDLDWKVLGADTLEIEGSDGFLLQTDVGDSTVTVTPTAPSTTYTLRATNAIGTATRTTTVEVVDFVVRSFVATPNVVREGETSTLQWVVEGEASVEIEGFGPQPQEGSLTVTVDTSTQFVLRAIGVERTETRTVTVSVYVEQANGMALSWSPDEVPGDNAYFGAFIPFDVYVVALNPTGGLLGFEVGVEIPIDLLIISTELLFDSPLDFGTVSNEFIVGVGTCIGSAPIIPLVRITLFDLGGASPYQQALYLRETTPSSVGGQGPALLNCAGQILLADPGELLFVVGDDGGVPAVSVQLEATWTEQGARLHWQAPGAPCVRSVTVLRGEGEGTEVVAELGAAGRVAGGAGADGGGADTAGRSGEWLRAVAEAAAARVDASGAARTAGSPCAPDTWTDTGALDHAGALLPYRVLLHTDAGTLSSTTVMLETAPVAPRVGRSRLLANVPNPFNPRTELRFELARRESVELSVHDLAGRTVRRFSLGERDAGPGQVTWTGNDASGRPVASGVYLVRLRTPSTTDTRRIVLVR